MIGNMTKKTVFFFLTFVFIFAGHPRLWAQVFTDPGPPATGPFDMTDFPQWARDLRRAEIVAFGTFPLVYIVANFGVDVFRMANNGWDRRFAPVPFRAPGGIDKNQQEMLMTLGVAAGGAIVLAVVDHGIIRARRNRQAREDQKLPDGVPIIIRRPLSDDESYNNNNNQTESP